MSRPSSLHPVLLEHDHSVLAARRWAQAGHLFAIVDACDTPSVPVRARSAIDRDGTARAVSLYKGHAEEELWAIAPYLFAVDVATFDWIIAELWSEPWGVFLLSDEPLEALRTHFRRYLTVKTPAGAQWYFRFYDPRVLRAYLGTCTNDELTEFLGPAHAVALTDPETYGVTVLSMARPPRPAPRIAVARNLVR